MPPKHKRLSVAEFSAVFAHGKRTRGKYMTLVYNPTPVGKCAVTVPKRLFKTAVERNRLRRRLYHALTTTSFFSFGGSVIVLASPAAPHATFAALCTELKELFGKVAKER